MSFLNVLVHVFLSNLGSLGPLFQIFCCFSSLLFPWDSHHVYVLCFLIFHRSPKLCSFSFILYSFYSSVWIISINVSLRLPILSSTCSNLIVNPYSEFFISVIVLLSSRICAWFLFCMFYLFIDIVYLFIQHSFSWFILSLCPWFPGAR